ncbi:MAG: o-succinylbenzoate synthase [Ilumatobacteraceae bacterium]
MSPLTPTEIELRRIHLDLVTPFRTSFGSQTSREILLIGLRTSEGVEGWGECVALIDPVYSPEYVDGVVDVIDRFMAPALFAAGPSRAADAVETLGHFKGHQMAKAALEMAFLDAELRAAGTTFHQRLGANRDRVPSGVSVGIFGTIDELLAAVQGYIDEGYARIKLKIEPGWDIEPVRLVRELIGPETGLQVDANTAYTRADIEHLRRLDEFDLLLIEQPLETDDLLGHRDLARAINTPVCLDESIESFTQAVDAVEIGAAEIINIKPGRVGGYLTAVRIHDMCRAKNIPVWCGGMLETGIGRAANCALASLDGFTLPGDISASTRFYARDIVLEPIAIVDGHVAVPDAPGLGFELDNDFLDSITSSVQRLSP